MESAPVGRSPAGIDEGHPAEITEAERRRTGRSVESYNRAQAQHPVAGRHSSDRSPDVTFSGA